jgi:cob(I)alamin adenosyltransferase
MSVLQDLTFIPKSTINMNRKGLLLVYTGDGKGKTTAAIGLALRAAGQGLNVLILQFMKCQQMIGEFKALAQTNLPITIEQYGRRVFFRTRTCEVMDIHKAHQGLKAFKRAMEGNAYDLIILDEINMAIFFGLLSVEEVIEAVEQKPPELHLMLTGRNADQKLIDMADLVTEMREIKHPYHQGVAAQKGIEF